MSLKTLLVEDEPHSLSRLLSLLRDFSEIEVLGSAEDGEKAIELIDALKPDLLFLDIQLPGMSGFDVLARARHKPAVIFVTAFDQYAVKAFEENAVDYLLKPTSRERLQQALARVSQNRTPLESQLVAALQRMLARPRPREHFSVKRGEEILLIPESEVCFFKAEDKYVFLCTAEHSYFYDATLKELEESLDPQSFFRIHKSYIVAIAKIRKLHKWFLNEYLVEMSDSGSTRLKVSRSYLPALKARLRF